MPPGAVNRIALPLLLVACSALGAWAVWEHIQRTRFEDRVTELESEAASRVMREPGEQSKPGDGRAVRKRRVGPHEVAGTAGAHESGTVTLRLSLSESVAPFAAPSC